MKQEQNALRLKFNVTGEARKRLVSVLGGILETKPKYLGAPSFAYKIGDFTVDKNGTVAIARRAGGEETKELLCKLQEHGFAPEPQDGVSLENTGLVVEMPRECLPDAALEKLRRLVESKGALIKKALGAETLDLIVSKEKVGFPWFRDGADSEAVKAYAHFVTALCEMARTQKRVTAKEKETENDKYAFRCFLLRLGFIGEEYKNERKILLRNLTGSAAFRAPKGGGPNNASVSGEKPPCYKA